MQKWEYLTRFVSANHYKASIPAVEGAAQFSLEYLNTQLNSIGTEGWELVSATPYTVGDKEDVMTHATGAVISKEWSHTYLCMFKRPLPDQPQSL